MYLMLPTTVFEGMDIPLGKDIFKPDESAFAIVTFPVVSITPRPVPAYIDEL